MLLGIDVSRYDAGLAWLQISKWIHFVFIKSTQGNYRVDSLCKDNIAGANSAGIPYALYHWCDPLVAANAQADYFLSLAEGSGCRALALDVEQQWADWAEWSAKKVTKLLSPNLISENARLIAERIKARSPLPVIIYTSRSFVAEYTPLVEKWAINYPLWLSTYPYKKGQVNATWEDILNNWQAMQSIKPAIAAPTLLPGSTRWDFWQFSGDKFILPGTQAPIDLNWYNGDDAQLRSLFRIQGETAIPLTTEQRLAVLEAAARAHGWRV
jgi:GH25 family lysozyme M1 (1,4-beta-N-acetylmuramidase)